MTRLMGLLVVAGVLAAASACGSSHDRQLGASAHRLPTVTYSGRLYSVQQVKRAFAALGFDLHITASQAPGLVFLTNNARLGPQHLPSPPRVVSVLVATRRRAADSLLFRGRYSRVTSYANVTAFSKPTVLYEVRGAVSALRWGLTPGRPGSRLIVPAASIGRIRLWESRADVEKRFGRGRSTQPGFVSYFGGHLLVNYWFHDRLYTSVQYLTTRWGGYRTRSGAHVGSTERELRPLYVTCSGGTCFLQAGPWPDPLGTTFTMRHGEVVEITIGSIG